jgi:hypothetical protein
MQTQLNPDVPTDPWDYRSTDFPSTTTPKAQRLLLDQACTFIAGILEEREHEHADRLKSCGTKSRCHSIFCLRCIRGRSLQVRKRLYKSLPDALRANPDLQLWLISGCAADSDEITTPAKSVVDGMRALFRHRRLANRIVSTFGALEIIQREGHSPFCHAHALVLTKPLEGKYYLSENAWIEIWESACSHHRQRPDPKQKLRRVLKKNADRLKRNTSLDARRITLTDDDVRRVSDYVTKHADTRNLLTDHAELLYSPDPDAFMERREQLRNVTHYFGNLAN